MEPDRVPVTQDEKVLYLLRTRNCTTHEFCSYPALAAEYRRSISNLRKKGYQIVAKKIDRGKWLYKLVSEPMPVKPDETGQFSFA